MRAQAHPDDVWYFAYGSNLDVDQKEKRTGVIREARRCRLIGYRLIFNKRGKGNNAFANIILDANREVWGVAYRCKPATLATMDTFEGRALGHYRQVTVDVLTDSGEMLHAITYVAGDEYLCTERKPTRGYAAKILNGARHHGLPTAYIAELERLTGVLK